MSPLTLAPPYPKPPLEIPDLPSASYPALSYELYPPRNTTANTHLWDTIRRLENTAPDFVSVTYGSSGSNRNIAVGLLDRLRHETTLKPLAHLTCTGADRTTLAGIVDELITNGVRGVLALRGDRTDQEQTPRDGLRYAQQLVELIRQVERRRAAELCAGRLAVGVAAYPVKHPESPSFSHDIEVLLAKQGSGADFAITQVFFQPGQYKDLVSAARRAGVVIPIIPGIMPLTNVRRLDRLVELAGLDMDQKLRDQLVNAGGRSAQQQVGLRATVELISDVLDSGAPGLHLYTFNEHSAALEVLEQLDLKRPHRSATRKQPTTPQTGTRQ